MSKEKDKDKKQTTELFPLPEPAEEEFKNKESADLLETPSMREKEEAEDAKVKSDLAEDDLVDTQHSDGHTYNPRIAAEQGLTYTPPHDPPVQPSEDDPQGADVAAGFAPSMEDTNPDVEHLPRHVDNNDLDLLDDVYEALQTNSETVHLDNVKVQVNNKVVYLLGTVETQDDVGRVHDIVNGLNGIRSIRNNLQVYP